MEYDLVFEGGGAKGMALIGAYEEFADQGNTHGRLLGTSAGAITAALVAAGYTPDEMIESLDEQENGRHVFAGFMGIPAAFTEEELQASSIRTILRDIDIRFVPDFLEERIDNAIARLVARNRRGAHLLAFIERGGWYAADRFVAWLEAKLDSGQWNGQQRQFSQMTLAEFFHATRIDVSLVASDTTDGRLLVLNHNTAPECPLVWAVRMSMSIPLVWDEVIWQTSWGPYQQRDISAHAIVDGGLLSNFPLELFISDEPFVVQVMGPRREIPVLGLLIDESLPVPPIAATRGLLVDLQVNPAEFRTVQRLRRLANTATTARDKMVIEAYEHLVVRLPALGYGTTEFEMSDERRDALIEGGRAAMRRWLQSAPGTAVQTRGMEVPAAAPPTSEANRVARRLLEPGP
jgi:NTE family protein